MKMSRIGFAVTALYATVVQHAVAGQVQSITDHSLPKAKIRTFYAQCTSGPLVIIRLDPESKNICGSSQEAGTQPICLPRPEKNAEDVVRQVTERLCP